jgi:hypothetical protein
MGRCIAMIMGAGFGTGLAYAGAFLAFDVAGLGTLVVNADPIAVLVFLFGGAMSLMPVVVTTGLASLPDEHVDDRHFARSDR